MSQVDFLRQHGYLVLTLVVLADQSGLPLPALPFLIAAGALIHDGTLNGPLLFACSLTASVLGHSVWYYAGRRGGLVVLRHVCRLSLQPDACMRRTQDFFTRLGPLSLIGVRFIPGLDTMMQPLAGLTGMAPGRYFMLNLGGAILWVGTTLGVGYAFGERLGTWLLPLRNLRDQVIPGLGLCLVVYLSFKLLQRQLALLKVQTPRISCAELKALMEGGASPLVVDLRTALEARLFPRSIPGAVRLGRRSLEATVGAADRSRAVVLFCNCPHEFSAARAALRLLRGGWTQVRPLAGGLSGWQSQGYAVVRLNLEKPAPAAK
jgi:membrane protein DedA with SNARE-associated domain/rhodanese-related sulfurtransferase